MAVHGEAEIISNRFDPSKNGPNPLPYDTEKHLEVVPNTQLFVAVVREASSPQIFAGQSTSLRRLEEPWDGSASVLMSGIAIEDKSPLRRVRNLHLLAAARTNRVCLVSSNATRRACKASFLIK